eukprot:tig00000093_g3665.t1
MPAADSKYPGLKKEVLAVAQALDVPRGAPGRKTQCCQIAPSVFVSVCEEFDMPPGSVTPGMIVQALHHIGFDHVFDLRASSDVTIMEEASELIERVKKGGPFPMFTSCCASWMQMAEDDYPELLNNLSTCKSPMSMSAALVKGVFAARSGLRPEEVVMTGLMPCTVKKTEAQRPQLKHGGVQDTDFVLTTKELGALLKAKGVRWDMFDGRGETAEFASLLGSGTGAGAIFGVTGGVMEAALRTGYALLKQAQEAQGARGIPDLKDLNITAVRGLQGVKEATLRLPGDIELKACVVHGAANVTRTLDDAKGGKLPYHFVEIMMCEGGCMNGAGQPRSQDPEILQKRAAALYNADERSVLRESHKNRQVQILYETELGKPLSHKSHELLHTHYLPAAEKQALKGKDLHPPWSAVVAELDAHGGGNGHANGNGHAAPAPTAAPVALVPAGPPKAYPGLKKEVLAVAQALDIPRGAPGRKTQCCQIAPSVFVSVCEEFDMPPGSVTPGMIVQALHHIGFDHVFDLRASSDVTIMEEASELIERVKKGGPFPMFTSCCASWMQMAEDDYPELLKNLSTCKSPMSMSAALVKGVFAARSGLRPEEVVMTGLMPCTVKKTEAQRPQLKHGGVQDTDFVLTTKELGALLKAKGVRWDMFDGRGETAEFASLLGSGTGAGAIFGVTGGVMEAALRTGYALLKQAQEAQGARGIPDLKDLNITAVRGLQGVKEATLRLPGDIELKACVVHGAANVTRTLDDAKAGKLPYHFVEIMMCEGGCMNGAGQPRSQDPEILQKRAAALYNADERSVLRESHKNRQVQILYETELGKPLSHKSHELLHTHYLPAAEKQALKGKDLHPPWSAVVAELDAHGGGNGHANGNGHAAPAPTAAPLALVPAGPPKAYPGLKKEVLAVAQALDIPRGAPGRKTQCCQIAPSVFVSVCEEFDMPPGSVTPGMIVQALHHIGFDHVFDLRASSDVTIMEEASELIERVKKGGPFPMFTSCCASWMQMAEDDYPELLKNLSTCKSPMSMSAALVKGVFAARSGLRPEEVVMTGLMPCTVKKTEAQRPQLKHGGVQDTDFVLTTKELGALLKAKGVRWDMFDGRGETAEFASLLGSGTGAGAIFGVTGGVMEAALRTGYALLKQAQEAQGARGIPDLKDLNITAVRGLQGVKEATLRLPGDIELKACVVHGAANVTRTLDDAKAGKLPYHFVEIMMCEGGCMNGAGQPRSQDPEILQKRAAALYNADERSVLRESHKNRQVQILYETELGKPLSHKSHELLHTHYLPAAEKQALKGKDLHPPWSAVVAELDAHGGGNGHANGNGHAAPAPTAAPLALVPAGPPKAYPGLKKEVLAVAQALDVPRGAPGRKTQCCQIAPSVFVSVCEEFDMPPGSVTPGMIVQALHHIGFDHVFDLRASSDVTIMEEASELIERVKKGGPFPMFTSCCASWMQMAEDDYPELLKNLSTCKSPMSMSAALVKGVFAARSGLRPEEVVMTGLMPCTVKKTEAQRPQLKHGGVQDTDFVLTTKELGALLKAKGVRWDMFDGRGETAEFASLLGSGTGAGAIFGVTGGVMEAALRTGYALLKQAQEAQGARGIPDLKDLNITAVRGLQGVKEATLRLPGDIELKACVVHGAANVTRTLDDAKAGKLPYHFVEIMMCEGGCMNGAGQPRSQDPEILQKRAAALYNADERSVLRESHKNRQVQILYETELGKPLSHKSHELLHTHYLPAAEKQALKGKDLHPPWSAVVAELDAHGGGNGHANGNGHAAPAPAAAPLALVPAGPPKAYPGLKKEVLAVAQALDVPRGAPGRKTQCCQIAPSVFVSVCEEFDMPPGSVTPGMIVQALHHIGFDHVFDLRASSDVTIMEEASELIERVKKGGPFPMFTSCCASWMQMAEDDYPELLKNLSTCKSPMSMSAALVKGVFAARSGLRPEEVVMTGLMPCTVKKTEAQRPQLKHGGVQDTDFVLTTKELGALLKAKGVRWDMFDGRGETAEFASLLGSGTGAGAIFGVTGGVMEAALRTGYALLKQAQEAQGARGIPDLKDLNITAVRGLQGVKEATLRLPGDIELKACVVHGAANVTRTLDDAKAGKLPYHFVEIMMCEGGCMNGAGQPRSQDPEILQKRAAALYSADERSVLRESHKNRQVQILYETELGKPLSHKSHELLHTHYLPAAEKQALKGKDLHPPWSAVVAELDAHGGGNGHANGNGHAAPAPTAAPVALVPAGPPKAYPGLKKEVLAVAQALDVPRGAPGRKTQCCQIAPSVFVSVCEEFDMPPGSVTPGMIVQALHHIGFDHVFDLRASSDVTIMEEASELIERVKKGGPFPMFTSCCASWMQMAEDDYPELLKNLSTCKSPMSMSAALVKGVFAARSGLRPEEVVMTGLMPCTVKKTEAQRPQLKHGGVQDTDFVLTTKELGALLKAKGVRWDMFDGRGETAEFASLLGSGTGAGAIFGVTGGVMEAALRTGYALLKQAQEAQGARGIPDLKDLNITAVRGLQGVKEATLRLPGDIELKACVVHGAANVTRTLDDAKAGKLPYHFVEIMMCEGGCMNGAGQPRSQDPEILQKRAAALYNADERSVLRESHKNRQVQILYETELGKPLSHKSHELLHTHYLPAAEKQALKGKDLHPPWSAVVAELDRDARAHTPATAANIIANVGELDGDPVWEISLVPEPQAPRPPSSKMASSSGSMNFSRPTTSSGTGSLPTIKEPAGFNSAFARVTPTRSVSFSAAGGQPGAAAREVRTLCHLRGSVLVVWGSETGKSEGLAKKTAAAIDAAGMTATLMDAEECTAETVASSSHIVFVTSTAGAGDFPENMKSLWESLEEASAGSEFEGVRYAVFGVGDKGYKKYCEAAKKVDERLAELGCKRLVERGSGDQAAPGGAEAAWATWKDGLLSSLQGGPRSAAGSSAAAAAPSASPPLSRKSVDFAPFSLETQFANPNYLFVVVVWGSETGKSEGLAKKTVAALVANGMSPSTVKLMDAEECTAETVASSSHIVFVTSTAGAGDFPENMKSLWESLEEASAGSEFEGVRYAVFGVGDKGYKKYCEAAKKVDERLAELGCKRLVERGSGDQAAPGGAEAAWATWKDGLLAALRLTPGGSVSNQSSYSVVNGMSVSKLVSPQSVSSQGTGFGVGGLGMSGFGVGGLGMGARKESNSSFPSPISMSPSPPSGASGTSATSATSAVPSEEVKAVVKKAPVTSSLYPGVKGAVLTTLLALDVPRGTPERKVVCCQIAPSTFVSISEEFDMEPGAISVGKIVQALHYAGFDHVFDLRSAADVTIMEEASELIERVKKGGPFPMFTSCCAGWMQMAEEEYPDLLKHLSSCKSPMSMSSALIKTLFAEKSGLKTGDLLLASLMPCTVKKVEAQRPQLQRNGAPDTDIVLTTRELGALFKAKDIRWDMFDGKGDKAEFSSFLGSGSGAGVIFGSTGGVMEAALRTGYALMKQQHEEKTGQAVPDLPNLNFEAVRGLNTVKEATVKLPGGVDLKACVVHGTANVQSILEQARAKHCNFHFVEIMMCNGGCSGGPGQPRSSDPEIIKKRHANMYTTDERSVVRESHKNRQVQILYEEFLKKPLSEESHRLLHTYYVGKKQDGDDDKGGGATARTGVTSRKDDSAGSAAGVQTKAADMKKLAGDFHKLQSGFKIRVRLPPEEVTIVYGSETGNAENVAKHLRQELIRCGVDADRCQCFEGDDVSADSLLDTKFLIVVVSTAGTGDFPDNIKQLWEELSSPDLPLDFLASVHYTVFGLGDSAYKQFCEAARKFDMRLEELGASRFLERGVGDNQADDGFETGLDVWQTELWDVLRLPSPPEDALPPPACYTVKTGPTTFNGKPTLCDAALNHPDYKPIPTDPSAQYIRLSYNSLITPPKHPRQALYLLLDVKDANIRYSAHDAVGVYPRNDPAAVSSFLKFMGLTGAQTVELTLTEEGKKAPKKLLKPKIPPGTSVHQLFTDVLDVFGRPTARFYKAVAKFAKDPKEKETLMSIGSRSPRGRYVFSCLVQEAATYADIFRSFPSTKPPLAHLVDLLPVMKPRLYTVASPPETVPGKMEIAVLVVKWATPLGAIRTGLTTGFLKRMTTSEGPRWLCVSFRPSLGVQYTPPEPIELASLGQISVLQSRLLKHLAV